jgi:PAS domain S-box-containing protein
VINVLRRLRNPPVFADEEQTRIGRLVHIIGMALALSALIPILHNAWAGKWGAVAALVLGELCIAAVLWCNFRGLQKVAVHLLVLGLLVTATLLIATSDQGFRDVALLVYPSTLVVAALFLDRRAFLWASTAAILGACGLVLCEVFGLRVTTLGSRASVRDLIDLLVLLTMTAASAGLVAGNLRASLARARRNEAALRESESRMRQLVDAAFEGIAIGEQGHIIEANEQLAQMHGYGAGELDGRPVADLVALESRPTVAERIRTGTTDTYEHLAVRKDGSVFPVEVRGRLMNYRGRPVRVTAVRDITERKRAEESLRHLLVFDDLLNDLLAGFVGASAAEMDAHICNSLRQIANLFGVEYAFLVQVSPDSTTWSSTHEWCAPGVTSQYHKYQNVPMGTLPWLERQLLAGEEVRIHKVADLPPESAPARLRWEAEGFKSTLQMPLRGRGQLVHGCIGLFSVAREVTWRKEDAQRLRTLSDAVANALERKRAEEALHQSREQLRALLSRLQSLREEERTRISREIHDHLGQLLTALKLDLRWLERRVSSLPDAEAQATLNAKIASARELANETIVSVQKIASELRPGILDRLGLPAAVETETQTFQSRTGIHCEWSLPRETADVPPDLATGAFRIFQEILTNIARHSHATHVEVRLAFTDNRLLLEVGDNGIGIKQDAAESPASLGLVGMQERATMLGGKIGFNQNPGGGTLVAVVLPLNTQLTPRQ